MAGESGSLELTCRALLVSAKADKRRLKFCRSARALLSCVTWARGTGDRRTYAAAAFELALIEHHLKDDLEWQHAGMDFGMPFNKPESEFEILKQCIFGFDQTWMFTADSTSWFYLNILQSLLPAQERSPLTQTETLMSKLGREYELRSQLQEAVSFSIDSENRYNRAGFLSALAAIPFLDNSDRIRLLQ